MKDYTYVVQQAYGLHARPAGELNRLAKTFSSTVTVYRGEQSADAKRLMFLMALGIKKGDAIRVCAEGADEDACIEALAAYISEHV